MSAIRLGHSPDADDAFMFFGLARGGVASELEFEHVVEDMETLNRRALRSELEVTAVSVHTYAFVAERYELLRCGASVGEGYGPRLVSRTPLRVADLEGRRIAIPGALTTASLALKLRLPIFEPVPVYFDDVFRAVESGEVEAGLVIHEGQLTYKERGLHLIEDLGAWWQETTGLPLPLGVNVVRRDLAPGTRHAIAKAIRSSIEHGLRQRTPALAYASRFGRGVGPAVLDEFVSWYVNERTLDLGEDGFAAIRRLLSEGASRGLVPTVRPDLLEPLAGQD